MHPACTYEKILDSLVENLDVGVVDVFFYCRMAPNAPNLEPCSNTPPASA